MAESSTVASKISGIARAAAIWLKSRPWQASLLASIGAAVVIYTFAHVNAGILPFLIAPFGASCALVFGAPASPLAKPRSVIGGHLVAGICGLATASLLNDTSAAMGIGVGLTIFSMLMTDTLHPPAGANPIVIVFGQAGWPFLITPLLVGSIAIVLFGTIYHRFVTGHGYGPWSRREATATSMRQ